MSVNPTHTKLAAVAERLIAGHGRDVTLRLVSRAEVTPGNPWEGPPAAGDTTLVVKAVFVGEIIAEDDGPATAVVIVSGPTLGTVAIEQYTELEDGTDKWRITDTADIRPGELRVYARFSLEAIQ